MIPAMDRKNSEGRLDLGDICFIAGIILAIVAAIQGKI